MTDLGKHSLLEVRDLKVHFPLKGGFLKRSRNVVHAVDGIDLMIARGTTLSLVGESGCGKTTVGRCIIGLEKRTEGEVRLMGDRIDHLTPRRLHPFRRKMGMVFQDPFSSLNSRRRVLDLVAEPIRSHRLMPKAKIKERVIELLGLVGLPHDAWSRWPHEFSGGQRQRICIARALAGEPGLLICDESVSALDVSVQAQILNLLVDLQARLGIAILFISHDLAVVEHLSHHVAVMYLGKIVETADRDRLFARPAHPYTQALLSAVPVPDPTSGGNRILLKGDVPSPTAPPSGCRFHTRCPHAFDRCRSVEPQLQSAPDGGSVACHLYDVPSFVKT
ncbi:ABC transporter ATP-binding protein [Hoeflea sp.]|uniref:ABC transporter ATP-binding protein n=1 Tax=Hoeflea sp. TaxID=1940281 RepID=UPI003A937690